jgi:ribosomal-protein-alanine N-acetyltransferase
LVALETERLRLRPWQADDRPALERMARDAEMMRYVTHGRTWSDDAIDELLERQARHLELHGVCFFAAELKAGGEVVGLVGLQPLDSGEFELGWWIWKDYWGQGLATEAARVFVDHAREVMNLDSLVAVIEPDNAASIRVADKLGLRFERRLPASQTLARRDDEIIALYRISL